MLPSFYRADGHLSPASGKWTLRRMRWHLECADAPHRPRERVTTTLSMPTPLAGPTKEQYHLEHAGTSRCSCGRSTALELAQKGRTRRPLLSIGRKGWLGPIQDRVYIRLIDIGQGTERTGFLGRRLRQNTLHPDHVVPTAELQRAFVETACMFETQASMEKAACCRHVFIGRFAMGDACFHIEYVLQQQQLCQRFVHATTQAAASQIFTNVN